jgi:hypothetical protein
LINVINFTKQQINALLVKEIYAAIGCLLL